MTRKQIENRKRFAAVQKEAKKLRKENKKLSQAQAVKQAWAIMYSKKKVGAAKTSSHKDTRSHNVNIKVVSGVDMYSVRDALEKNIKATLLGIEGFKKILHDPNRPQNKADRIFYKKRIAEARKHLVIMRRQLRDQNKLINSLLK